MSDAMIVTDNLNKISISIEAGTSYGKTDLTPSPLSSEFIFGIGTQGLTDFEYEIAGKEEGDIVSLSIKNNEINHHFQHISAYWPLFPQSQETIYLMIRLVKISKAKPVDVMKALAAMTESCACDCGCDGHSHSGVGDSCGDHGCASD